MQACRESPQAWGALTMWHHLHPSSVRFKAPRRSGHSAHSVTREPPGSSVPLAWARGAQGVWFENLTIGLLCVLGQGSGVRGVLGQG